MQLQLIPDRHQQLAIPTVPRRRVVMAGRSALVYRSAEVAYSLTLLKRPGKGGRLARPGCLYVGGSDIATVSAIARLLRSELGLYVVQRPAKRLTGHRFELRASGSLEQLEAAMDRLGDRPSQLDLATFRKQDEAQATADAQSWLEPLKEVVKLSEPVGASAGSLQSDRPALPRYLSYVWDRPSHCSVFRNRQKLGVVAKPKFSHLWSYKPTGGEWAGDFMDWREGAIALDEATQTKPLLKSRRQVHDFRVKMNPVNPKWGRVFDGDQEVGEIWQATATEWRYGMPGLRPRWHRGGTKGQAIKCITDRVQGKSGGVSLL